MTLDEALEIVVNALADRPSGPDPREIVALIQAGAWSEGYRDGLTNMEYYGTPIPNPYRPAP